MAKNYRAGGQWAQPWDTMDHARSHLTTALVMLRRELAPGDYGLLTMDEADLLRHINEAILAIGRIKA